MRETSDADRKRLDLSVPQVAGSAVAAVVAAKLASYFGVYGTILGAGVVSVVATCGDKLFQHFFKSTAEQLRETTPPARPRKQAPQALGEFTEATVHRARVKSWRRPAVAAAVIFGVTMAGITTYELMSGSSFSGGTGTTVGDAVTRRGSASTPDSPSKPNEATTPSGTPSHEHTSDVDDQATPTTAPTPSATPSGDANVAPDEVPSDSASSSPAVTPKPGGTASTPSATPEPATSSQAGTRAPATGVPE
jgi:cytoskeletal protein RodZ